MRTINLTYPHALKPDELLGTVAAIGFFDGIHKGHQRVIQRAVAEAKERHMESAVITFYPHPSVVLRNNRKHVKYITTAKEKKELLEKMNVDRLYIITFNKELSLLSPQHFIDHFIIGLHIKHLVAGFDFSYGHKGKGNMESLKDQTRGEFTFEEIDKVTLNNEKISSTQIRKLLDQGDVRQAALLLGRPFLTYGIVVEGEKRGRELGYPTANLKTDPEALLPKPGIYAVNIIYQNEKYHGMASLGTNPTFTEDRRDLSLEVNILDFNQKLYGTELKLEWMKFIRNEEKFDRVDVLIDQIAADEKIIRNFFAKS